MRTRALVLALVAATTACGSVQRPAPVSGSAAPDPLPEPEYVSCASRPFSPTAFEAPPNAEEGDSPLAEALRRSFSKRGIEPIPTTGWRLLYESGASAMFGSGDPPEVAYVELRRVEGRWEWSGSGGCAVQPWKEGLTTAVWTLDPAARPLRPDTRELSLLVEDPSCSGGRHVGDRLLPPEVVYTSDAVLITFYAEPLPPRFYTCIAVEPPPSTAVTLESRLGGRKLLNGSYYPPFVAERPYHPYRG